MLCAAFLIAALPAVCFGFSLKLRTWPESVVSTPPTVSVVAARLAIAFAATPPAPSVSALAPAVSAPAVNEAGCKIRLRRGLCACNRALLHCAHSNLGNFCTIGGALLTICAMPERSLSRCAIGAPSIILPPSKKDAAAEILAEAFGRFASRFSRGV